MRYGGLAGLRAGGRGGGTATEMALNTVNKRTLQKLKNTVVKINKNSNNNGYDSDNDNDNNNSIVMLLIKHTT